MTLLRFDIFCADCYRAQLDVSVTFAFVGLSGVKPTRQAFTGSLFYRLFRSVLNTSGVNG